MVEQNSVHCEQSVGFPIISGHPVRIDLGRAVGRARVERRQLVLRRRGGAEHLRRGRLVKPAVHSGKPNGFQQSNGTHPRDVAGVHGLIEADADVRLGREVVHLVGLDSAEQRHQPSAVNEVAVVQEQSGARIMGIDVEVIDPRRVERRRPADQPVNLVSLPQQQFSEIRAVLPGDPGDERSFHPHHASCRSPNPRQPLRVTQDVIEHLRCQPPGEHVLLTGVVAAH